MGQHQQQQRAGADCSPRQSRKRSGAAARTVLRSPRRAQTQSAVRIFQLARQRHARSRRHTVVMVRCTGRLSRSNVPHFGQSDPGAGQRNRAGIGQQPHCRPQCPPTSRAVAVGHAEPQRPGRQVVARDGSRRQRTEDCGNHTVGRSSDTVRPKRHDQRTGRSQTARSVRCPKLAAQQSPRVLRRTCRAAVPERFRLLARFDPHQFPHPA